jgi:hypothetical protein
VFLDFLGLKGDLEKQAAQFKEIKSREKEKGKEWAQKSIINFIVCLNEKSKEGKFGRGTIRNYYKPVKCFCDDDSHRIELGWKKITKGLGRVKRFAKDRAPYPEEIQDLIEYPNRQIKLLMAEAVMD